MKLNAVFASVLMLCLSACNDISEDNRLIEVEAATVKRTVLIEDFTGQKCLYCPQGAEAISALQKQYSATSVIAVAIHAGPLSVTPETDAQGLSTPTGNTYYRHWNIEELPTGLVNRSGKTLNVDEWGAKVHEQLERVTPVSIAIDTRCDAVGRKGTVKVRVKSTEDTDGKLQIWLTEDAITAFQRMPDGTYNDQYLHNHVFRTAVNGDWGEAVKLRPGTPADTEHTLNIPAAWDITQLHIVAFIYNDDGVQQAAIEKLMK